MKFTVPGKAFQNHLSVLSKVLSSKNTISALDNFLLHLEGNTLLITGSDSENTMQTQIEVFDVEGSGEVAVSSKTLLDITKEIGNQPITFNMDDENLNIDIKYTNGHFEMTGVNGDEYPRRNEDEEEVRTLVLPAEVVTKGIGYTIYAVSTETIRPMMTGIFWDIKEDHIVFVSTDTHKLVKYINRQAAPGFEGGFVLPSKPASIIAAAIGKDDSEVKIEMGVKGATFHIGSYVLRCKFIKGTYPNYERVIPQTSPYTLTVDRESLFNAVRRVALMASKSTSLVKFNVTSSQIHMLSKDFDYARQGEERVDCSYDGPDMSIGFSTEYMLEILGNIPGEDLRIKLSDPARPGIFEPVEETKDESLVVLQMPIQVLE